MWGEREVRGLAREGKEREGIGLRERRKWRGDGKRKELGGRACGYRASHRNWSTLASVTSVPQPLQGLLFAFAVRTSRRQSAFTRCGCWWTKAMTWFTWTSVPASQRRTSPASPTPPKAPSSLSEFSRICNDTRSSTIWNDSAAAVRSASRFGFKSESFRKTSLACSWKKTRTCHQERKRNKKYLPRTITVSDKKNKETVLKLSRSRLSEKQKSLYAGRQHC